MNINKHLRKKIFFITMAIVMSIVGVFVYHYINYNKNSSIKNKNILLSIIVPVYNVENYISICLDSLINQTYKNIEIVCVNDGSKDNSLNILNQYKDKDSRIILIDKKNGGVSSARNAGINASNGDFITFVDADDYVDINTYKNCIDTIIEKNADILAFGYIQEPEHKIINPYKNKFYNAFDCLKNEFTKNCTVWNKIFKRSILFDENIRFAEDVAYGEDDLFLKMVTPNAKKIFGCADAYYHYNTYRETSAENTYSIEKKLISAINRCDHLINYYINKNYTDEWILTHCLDITYYRINSLEDKKKKKYSEHLLSILDSKLLKMLTNISEYNNNRLNELRINSKKI